MSHQHRIYIVDDHSVVRHGLATLLARVPELKVSGEAATYDEALAGISVQPPDLAVIDITLKDRSGLDLIRELRAKLPDLKTLVLSMHDEMEYAERALRAGARGYIMKENADDVLVEAIRAVLRGEIYVSPSASKRMVQNIAEGTSEPDSAGGIASLTDRERDVFDRLGQGFTTKRIADELGLSARTVEVHRANIKRKLGCTDAAQVLREAVKFVESRR
jgi:DNA-binding NarL/FixJ family response regulator